MNKLTALAWEQWRQARLVIGLCLGLTLLTDTLVWLSFRQTDDWQDAAELACVIALILMEGIVLTVLWGSANPHDVQPGFQRRLYRLPLASWKLVTILGVARLLLVTTACGLILGMHNLFWSNNADLPFAVLLPVVLIYVLLQGISWSFGTCGWKSVIAAVLAIIYVTSTFEDQLEAFPLQMGAAAIVLLYLLSLIGIRLDRRGTWQTIAGWRQIVANIAGTTISASRLNFTTPEKAQFWFEWRRRGRVFLAIAILPFSVLLLWIFNSSIAIDANWPPEFPQEFRAGLLVRQMQVLFFVLPFITLTMGLIMLAMDRRDKLSGVANFLAVRPVDSRLLARARLKAYLRMIYMYTAIAVVGGIVCLALRAAITPNPPTGLHGFYEHFAYYVMPLEGLRDLVAFAILTLIAAWTLLWVATRLALILFVLLALLPATIGSIGDVLINDADLYALYAMVICIALTVWAFVRAHRSSLVKAYWALPAYVVLACLCLYCQSILAPGILNHQDQLWLIGLLSLSIAPFATIPLSIHRRRSSHGGILS